MPGEITASTGRIKTIINLQNDKRRNMCNYRYEITNFFLCTLTTGSADLLLCSATLWALQLQLPLSVWSKWIPDMPFVFCQKIFSLSFSNSPTRINVLCLFCNVRGGRWAFGSRGKQLTAFNFSNTPPLSRAKQTRITTNPYQLHQDTVLGAQKLQCLMAW